MPLVRHKRNCTCCVNSTTATQSLDEVAFSRSACAAALIGDLAKLQTRIARHPEALNDDGYQGDSGFTPLHYASRAGHAHVVKYLLESGADPNRQTSAGGATPLHRAAVTGRLSCVELLLMHGSDPLLKDGDGQTAYDKAKQAGHEGVAALIRRQCPEAVVPRQRQE